MAVLQSQLRLTVFDGTRGPLRAINAQLDAFRTRMRAATLPVMGMTGRLAALGGGYLGVTAGFRGTAGGAIKFEEAFADVRKVLDATPEQMENIRRQVLGMSKVLPTSAEGIASIYAAAAQSNVPINELGKFSEMVAKVAVAWDTTEGDTSQALAEIKTQLRMNVDEIGLYADAINHLSNNTPARAAKLVEFSRRVAAQGEMFGFSAQESLAFGSAMVSMGAEAEIAATSFRNMGKALTRGAGTKKEAMRGWRRVGLDPKVVAKEMQKDAAKTTMKVIEAVQKVAKHERADIAFALFGEEARALMPVINDAQELRRQMDMVGQETNYAGSAFKEYMERANTTSNVLAIMRNRVRAIGIEIGDRMLPSIKEFAIAVSDVFDTLGDRVTPLKRLETIWKGFTQGLGYDGSIKSVVNDLADLLLGKIDPAKGAEELGRLFMKMKDWGKAVRELSDAIRDNPIAKFVGEMAGHGFKLFIAAAGFTLLAGALTKLAKAAWMLSGAGVAVGIIKMMTGLGGALLKVPKLSPAPKAPGGKLPGGVAAGGGVAVAEVVKAIVSRIPQIMTAAATVYGTGRIAAELSKDNAEEDRRLATPRSAEDESMLSVQAGKRDAADWIEDRRARKDSPSVGFFNSPAWKHVEGAGSAIANFGGAIADKLREWDRGLTESTGWKANVPSAPASETINRMLEGMRNLAPQADPLPTLESIRDAVGRAPSGTHEVREVNPVRPNINMPITVYATTMADAGQIASQVGAKVQDTLAGYYSDGAYA